MEVVVGLGLLERRLPVLPDEHEGREHDGLEGDRQCQGGPRALLEQDHPEREDHDMQVDERH
jgi:hypothetical protein